MGVKIQHFCDSAKYFVVKNEKKFFFSFRKSFYVCFFGIIKKILYLCSKLFVNMIEVTIKDSELSSAALEGMDAFLQVIIQALRQAIGGEPTADTIQQLTADQMTLLCWDTLHEEVMSGGFIQLIHNGYGSFIFKNPFAKALNKMWSMRELSKLLYEVHTLWLQNRDELERDCTDDEFMALYERFPQFDDYDDWFIENEESLTEHIAHYVDENMEKFATII